MVGVGVVGVRVVGVGVVGVGVVGVDEGVEGHSSPLLPRSLQCS